MPLSPEATGCPTPCGEGAHCIDDGLGHNICVCEDCWKVADDEGNCYIPDLDAPEEEYGGDEPIPDILHDCPDDQVNEEEIQELLLHGCHCGKLGELTSFIEQLGGLGKVDELDQECMMWKKNRKCVTLPGGSCYGVDTSTAIYTLKMNHKTGFTSCAENSDPCTTDLCTIDSHYTFKILGHMHELRGDGNFTAHVSSVDECPFCQTCIPPSRCYGEAPFLHFDKDMLKDDWDWL